MLLHISIPLAAVLAIVPPAAARQEAGPRGVEPAARPVPADPAPLPADLPASVRDELATLEARLRVREARVREAELWLDLWRLEASETSRERGLGVESPRAVQIAGVRLAEAETQLEARRAERDQIAGMLDRLRRRVASPSPEPDLDELRAAIEGEVRAAESRLRAQEARLRAAELDVDSDDSGQEGLLRAIRSGAVSPLSLKRNHHQTNALRNWRALMEAERDLARIALERHRRRLDAFDRADRPEEGPDPSSLEGLRARVDRLEDEAQVLRDEVYYLEGSLMRPRRSPSLP